jgi:hypothetical protein
LRPECSDKRVGKRAASIFKRHRRLKDFLLAFNHQAISLKDALESRCDFACCEGIGAVQNLHGLDHGYDADETWIFLSNAGGDDIAFYVVATRVARPALTASGLSPAGSYPPSDRTSSSTMANPLAAPPSLASPDYYACK